MHHQLSKSTKAVASTTRMDLMAPEWRFITSVARWDKPARKQLNAVVNKSRPPNMRGPVYKTVKMDKVHWRIQTSDFWGWGGGGGEPTG